jgi:hypothetical protein
LETEDKKETEINEQKKQKQMKNIEKRHKTNVKQTGHNWKNRNFACKQEDNKRHQEKKRDNQKLIYENNKREKKISMLCRNHKRKQRTNQEKHKNVRRISLRKE